jgi:hypothetical protein
MESIELAVRELGKKSVSPAARERAVRALDRLVALIAKAEAVWQQGIAKPAGGSDRFSIVVWLGADRARALHELGLAAHDASVQLTHAAGGLAEHLTPLDSSVIVNAYGQLKEGETPAAAAQAALARLRAHGKRLAGWRDHLARTAAAKKKPAAKKNAPARKKAGRKTAKKKAARKAPKKKSAKKPAKRPAVKKKPKKKVAPKKK